MCLCGGFQRPVCFAPPARGWMLEVEGAAGELGLGCLFMFSWAEGRPALARAAHPLPLPLPPPLLRNRYAELLVPSSLLLLLSGSCCNVLDASV